MELVATKITELEALSKSKVLSDFKSRSLDAIKVFSEHYEGEASQYFGKVFQKIKKEAVEGIYMQLFIAFDA